MWILRLKGITCRRRSLDAWSDLFACSLHVLRMRMCVRRAFSDNTNRNLEISWSKFSFAFPRDPYSERTAFGSILLSVH